MNKNPVPVRTVDDTVKSSKIYGAKVQNSRWHKRLSGKYLSARNSLIKHKEQET